MPSSFTEETIYESAILILAAMPSRSRREGAQTAVFYDDDKIHICRRLPEHTLEIVLHHPREGEVTVYRVRVDDVADERAVEVYRVGLWLGHLRSLREHADEIKRAATFTPNGNADDLGTVDDAALFPEYRGPVTPPRGEPAAA